MSEQKGVQTNDKDKTSLKNIDEELTSDSIEQKNERVLSPEVQEQLDIITGGEDLQQIKSVDTNNEQILNPEIVKEKLTEVATVTNKKQRKKSNITSIILLIVNIILVYFIASSLFKSADDASLSNLFYS